MAQESCAIILPQFIAVCVIALRIKYSIPIYFVKCTYNCIIITFIEIIVINQSITRTSFTNVK